MNASGDSEAKQSEGIPSYLFYILRHLDHLGWDRVENLSDDLLNITLTLRSRDKHQRLLRLSATTEFPSTPPTVELADVPEFKPGNFPLQWDENLSRIVDLVDLCQNMLDKFTPCLDILATIDEECVVLDPRPVLGTEMHRRIALDNSLSLHLLLSPECMPMPKEVRFLGPEQRAKELRRKYMEHGDQYDCSKSLLDNLECMLGVEIPSQLLPHSQGLNETASQGCRDCCICFSYNLDPESSENSDEVVHPDVFCEDERCSRPYHALCLWKALISNRESKTMLNGVRGKCLYCNADIWCRLPD